jgi:hypothetical protein
MTGIFALLFVAAVIGVFKPYIKGLRRWHFALAAFVALILVGMTAPAPDKAKSGNAAAPGGTAAPSGTPSPDPAASPAPTSKWAYSEDKDEMRGDITRYATLDSENEVDLDFPYGTVHGQITVRRRKQDGLNVLFSVEKGQILCHSFTDSYVSVKFDDKPIQKFRCTSASDGSTETAFLMPAGKALAGLRTAKRVVIEAEFFQKGRQQFTFEAAGLRWK